MTVIVDVETAKAAARALRKDLSARGVDLTHSAALELVAHQLGHRDWNTASALLAPGEEPPQLRAPVPVLRVLDGEVGREFYSQLGFELLWEHRFEPDLPLYQRLRRDEVVLDLSEHYGDGVPGTVVWVPVRDVRALHAELRPRLWAHQRPGLEEDAPGGPTFTVGDPYGNHLRFCQPASSQKG
ncbi:MAG: glyoxalase superfamily protein [Quadrisphaera sp.]